MTSEVGADRLTLLFAVLSLLLTPYALWDLSVFGRDVFYHWEAIPFFSCKAVSLGNLLILIVKPSTRQSRIWRMILVCFFAIDIGPFIAGAIISSVLGKVRF